jgi:regulator of RNase E activity RraB
MERDGSDLGPPRTVDFSHVFADQDSANRFSADAGQIGFLTTITEVVEWDTPWDVKASKNMVPTVENITATEEQLDHLARKYGGRVDGWGFMRE